MRADRGGGKRVSFAEELNLCMVCQHGAKHVKWWNRWWKLASELCIVSIDTLLFRKQDILHCRSYTIRDIG